jgi:HPt (histidine-containing phosphotransfer) domain-containing protein
MGEREQIIQELDVKLTQLVERHRELQARAKALEDQNRMLTEQNQMLQQTLNNMKDAKALILGAGDIKTTKLQISRLIREIDKCIALLSV